MSQTSVGIKSALQANQFQLSFVLCDSLIKMGYQSSAHFVSQKLQPKTKDFKTGDIILPRGCINLNDKETVELIKYMDENCKDVVSKISQDKYSLLAIYLDRPTLCKNVLQEVQEKAFKYGHSNNSCEGVVLLRKSALNAERTGSSLQGLRCSVLQEHLRKLLEAQGYRVLLLSDQGDAAEKVNKACNDLRSKALKKIKACGALTMEAHEAFSNPHDKTDMDRAGVPHSEETEGEDVVLNLKEIMTQNNLIQGNEGYDKNLDKVKVVLQGEVSETLEDAIQLEAEINQATEGLKDPVVGCIHLIPHAKSFKNQQMLLVYQTTAENHLKQSQISVGPVNIKENKSAVSQDVEDIAKEFHRLRFDQIKKASEMRLGHMGGSELESTLSNMTRATINIDVLQNAAHVPLHLDLSCDDGVETRTGAFVMYNTARLKTLHANFLQQVEQGMYPPLPPVSEIDFSLLREEEEWELIFLYIARFPELLNHAVEVVVPTDGKLAARIHSHKVTNFLVSFSKCLSSYYSRYHILGEGETHLLPKMYARLYLMKAAHQVLLNGLETIGVKALDYL